MTLPPRLAALFLFATSLVIAAPEVASGACPLVVDSSGPSDPSNGQYTGIQAAVNAFKASPSACDTIEIRDGTYLGTITLFDVLGPLTIDAAAGVLIIPGKSKGFEFRRSSNIALVAEAGAQIIGSSNEPISFKGGSAANSDILVANWDIHDNGGGKDSACIDIEGGNTGIRVVNNLCRNNGSTAIHVAGEAEIVNNTVILNSKNGILVSNGANAVVVNNLSAFNGSAGGSHANIVVQSPASLVLENNIAYGGDGDLAGAPLGSNLDTSVLGAGLTLDDFFVDPAANDYHLAAGSPAGDAGLADPVVPATDFEGDPRLGTPDIGLDERLPDLDLDGVVDVMDNCPPITIPELDGSKTANPDQGDFDGDGYGNRCDTCWAIYNPADPNAPDLDGDGRPDQTDAACETDHTAAACPTTNGGSCEVLSEVLFTSASAAGTATVPPLCGVNLRFQCDRDGVPIPPIFRYFNLLSDAIGVIPQGDATVNSCELADFLPPAALQGAGTITCEVIYANDVVPEDCDPAVSDCGTAFGTPVFQGEIPSGIITVNLDPNAPDNDQACSPGFWKNASDADWAVAGLFKTDDFDTTFGTDAFDPDITLLEAASLGGSGVNLLTRKAVSGLLSALDPRIRYPYSPNAVIIIVRNAIDDDPPGEASAAAATLPASSEIPGGCPL